MPIETLEDIIEAIADKLGIYGAHCEKHDNCRVCFVSNLTERIKRAVEIEEKIYGR